ncbi:MAG TPA: response regulator [Verrucomicrobiae bacterium]|nr:response regulator [Verrucomicrobiae bacterium]
MPSLKLLIVEDDIANLELMTEVFAALEADVCPVSNSEHAAELINKQRFDGIFLDLDMPSPDGFQLAQLVRKSPSNKSTPIVIVTGIDDRNAMRDAFSTGATFFLQKPIDRQKLGALFRTVRGGMSDNRRRYIRVPLRTSVTCTVGSRKMKGNSWNISQGGVQLEVDGLKLKNMVQLWFRFPVSDAVVEATGVVVWASQERQGIQFTDVSAQVQGLIRDFINAAEK